MFQNYSQHKKQEKICQISNLSNSQNQQYRNKQERAVYAKNFANQSQKNQQKQSLKPIFIITPDVSSRHINTLTQILQKNRVPIQYQHQTQSLGQQLNTRFFVVVDNKNGVQKLGKQFNSPLMTIVGYPKIGNNKQNIYCQYAEDVLDQYKQFFNAKNKDVLANEEYQVLKSQLNNIHQESTVKCLSNGFSVLRSNISGLKLKSISKYNKEKSHNKFFHNKQNITSIQDIHNHAQFIHSLYFLQSLQNQPFNNMIGRFYHEIKLKTSKKISETTFYFRAEGDLVTKINEFNPFNSKKSINKIQNQKDDYMQSPKNNPDKSLYVLVSSQCALKLATRIMCEFYAFKDKIKLIVAMLKQQKSALNDVQNLQKQMLLVKKTIHSSVFQSLVCSEKECQKMLKSLGFKFSYQVPQIKVTSDESKQILTKCNQKISTITKKLKTQKEVPIQQEMINFCVNLNNTKKINKDVKFKQICQSEQITVPTVKNEIQRQNNLMAKSRQIGQIQSAQSQQFLKPQPTISCIMNKNKIIIPPLSSMLSPQKSSGSSTESKIKIIKVFKKEPQNQSTQKASQKVKSISQVNSEYCLNKNKSIVQKIQSRIASSNSRGKLSSKSIGSRKSIQNRLKSQQKIPFNHKNNPLYKAIPQYYQKSLSNQIQLTNIRDSQQITPKIQDHYYQLTVSPDISKVKKMKLNLNTDEPFVARSSQITSADQRESQSSYKKIRKLKKQVQKDSHHTVPASEYYFGSTIENNQDGSTIENNQEWKKGKSARKHQNFINGLVHVEYNDFIGLIVNEFKKNCPSSIIHKNTYKPFYLSCEYSKQIKRIWSGSNKRGILPSLVDLQGLREICKYYSNVMYEDDQLQYYSNVQDKKARNDQRSTSQFTAPANLSDDNCHMLLFFTIVTQKQAEDQVFQKLDSISQRLPRHEVIKCVVEETMSDNQMKEKANQIYIQMINYFTELKQEYGDGFVQTV